MRRRRPPIAISIACLIATLRLQSYQWHDQLMKHTKISVTLEADTEAELRRVAGERGISAFINEAVQQHLQATRLRHLLDEMEAESGPIPKAVRNEVDALAWPG